GAILRCQPASHENQKQKNSIFSSNDDVKVDKPTVKSPIRLANLVSQKQLPDTLHLKSKTSMCPFTACLGSLMQNTATKKENVRSKAEILTQATKFIEEYYMHLKKCNLDEMKVRLDEIAHELNTTGTYTPTTKELEFGARTAWRNASRCIGRIQWRNLNFFDARHVRNTKEMFEAVCKHIEFATNDGNIRSCITVFPPRVAGREDFRLWNPQLVSYAGYLQPDGSVIGDPARVVLTRICEKLGWKGKGGRFDVLPLIFSAPKERAVWYELPKRLVLEVELEHPKFDWLAEMNLRWYALPAVSDMLFDVGGIEFTAAPFNGWYMGTEIGARDLCDKQRYNLLPVFGEKMGVSIEDPISLWQDEVLLEVNRAVLHSFAKAGVTLVDHHTASQQFLQHMENETKNRGGCPADWVWIVPPMSASITGVFHQEMINYHLKPSFEYQEQAWKHYEWKKVQVKTRLSTVAYAVLSCVRIMNAILKNRVKATILYATETGRSEMFAEKLRKRLSSSFAVQVICMEDYELNHLPLERLIFVVASTFGNGASPDNGKLFWKSICNNQKNKNSFDLTKLMFSVFGLGSSLYPKFGAFGKNIDKKLRELNARSLKPVTIGDEMKGQEKLFAVWCDTVYAKALKVFGLDESDDVVDDSDEEITIGDTEAFGS
ncbi:Nitric oxide synthase, inducible, partial [Pseudolycoriella hygida]